MNKFKQAKWLYQSTKIPQQLSHKVQEALHSKKKPFIQRQGVKVLSTITATCALFIVLVNVNESFAKAIDQIPFLADVANLVRVTQIHEENELDIIHANIPTLQNTGNEALENTINQRIQEKLDHLVEQSRQEAKTIKEMIKDQEGDYQFEPVNLTLDYEIKSQQNGILSFVITEEKSDKFHANVSQEKYMYTIDLTKNKELTLTDLLGEDNEQMINQQIANQIQEIQKTEPTAFFTQEEFPQLEHGGYFQGIHENQKFYVNDKGNVVIVFEKYEIAPGYRGMPEFEIIQEAK